MATTDEPVVATETPVTEAPAAAEVKPVKKPRTPAAHPPYIQMITEAISTLKERSGSSQYAITKFIEDKQKNLPPNFKKLMLNQLKKFVTAGKLVKVKASYKLSSKPIAAEAKKPAAAPKPKPAAKPKAKAVAKPKSVAAVAKAKAKAKPVVKPKAAAAVKPKTVVKAKAPVKPKAKPAKVARTTPGKVVVAKPVTKKMVAKSVKAKIVKSPAKKGKK